MPTTCIVVKCGSRGDRDSVKFYAVPTVLTHKFQIHKNELSKKRRALWIAAIKRDDLTGSILRNQKVCSRHFITGKPAALEDENHPDWVPSQNMGHSSVVFSKKPGDVKRAKRSTERAEKLQQSVVDLAADANVGAMDIDPIQEEETETGIGSQTDITMEELIIKFEQLRFASKTIENLELRVEKSPFGLMENIKNNEKWKYYTGFVYDIVHIIFEYVESSISLTSLTVLSRFNQLLLALIKLRLDLHFKDLAYRFNISRTMASRYFEKVIHILYIKLKSWIIWPDRDVALKNIPTCFKEAFHDKTTIILDCFEVFIEKPPFLLTNQQTWSNYKHHNTVKFLIGITPQGTVSYISNAWGGRASDKQIVDLSNFCNFLKPGDVVLADRGFLIKETLAIFQAKVIVPAFTKGKDQLHPLEIEETRNIPQVRIHVERIIARLKNKFNIFKGIIPISMLKNGNNSETNILDEIVTVCCALINISPPIVPP